MIEIELKFRIPADRLAQVRRAVATSSAETIELQAAYFDTQGGALAAARLAARVRREGAQWVQALKTAGDGVARRGEHEVMRGSGRRMPEFDPAAHVAAPEMAQALQAALAADPAGGAGLHKVFETQVRRTRRLVRAGPARIELALDEGVIRAGAREAAVAELEFELKAGRALALFELAAQWVDRHRLWLDPRSKAERGEALARGDPPPPAVKSRSLALSGDTPPGAALKAMVGSALAQVLHNAAVLADERGRPEHVHQLRVGLRRLRSALRIFGAMAPDAEAAGAIESAARPLFAALGSRRDQDVVSEMLAAPLYAAGLDPVHLLGQAEPDDPGVLVRGGAFNRFALQVLAFAATDGAPDGPSEAGEVAAPASLQRLARQGLARAWKRIERDAGHFADITEDERHALRKRAKRLRYALEFTADLWPQRRTKPFLAALARAQDVIGAYNDSVVADELLRSLDRRDPSVAFAAGWVTARRAEALRECERPLRRLLKAQRPWVKG